MATAIIHRRPDMSTTITQFKSQAEAELAAQFEATRPAGLDHLRKEAFTLIKANGLPTRRIEAWHYTDLRSMMKAAATPAKQPSKELSAKRPWSLVKNDNVFSFVDGWLVKTPALPKGVSITTLEQNAETVASAMNRAVDLGHDTITALNTAFMTSGLVIEIKENTEVKEPLSLAFETTDASASYGRVIINVAAGASLTVIETHRGKAGAASQDNTVVEFTLGKGANVEHIRVNTPDPSAQSLSTLAVSIAETAQFNSLSFTTGALLVRHQVFARVHGNDAHVGVRGVTLLRDKQHADTTLVVEHDALNGISRELFKTIVDDEARGVFQGKIIVKPQAQKTDGQMASNTLLLGEFSAMNSKPELEIFADDVVCAHGATVGNLDDDLLFYLRSRGISRKEAEALMIQAFAGDALEHVTHDELKEQLIGMTTDWLKARG
jgi:Fe-S cluster assembly protein SufD